MNNISTPRSHGSMLYLLFCCFASALGGLLFGYDLFVISGTKDLIVQGFNSLQ